MSRATFYWKKRELRRLLANSPHEWWPLFAAEYGIDLDRL
jgi:hypothetical protein